MPPLITVRFDVAEPNRTRPGLSRQCRRFSTLDRVGTELVIRMRRRSFC